MICTYTIYSAHLDRYYIGACQGGLDERIKAHNTSKYGSHHFTAKANDWELYLALPCKDYSHAIRLERKIKSMKSRKYLENLKKYKEMRERIIIETSLI